MRTPALAFSRHRHAVIAGLCCLALLLSDRIASAQTNATAAMQNGQPASTDMNSHPDLEATLHGFPVLRDSSGKKLADGDFAQWLEHDRLHVKIVYDFGGDRRVEETAVFRQTPRLVQDQWLSREWRDGKLFRELAIDFLSGHAASAKVEGKELKHWSEDFKIEPGKVFAGFGFVLAIKSRREELMKGEKIDFQTVGFMPQPHLVGAEISFSGIDRVPMSGRMIAGDHFLIRPQLPAIAKVFVTVSNSHIWLTRQPASFLRWEGQLGEPSDPMIRVDLLPGEPSAPAVPPQ